MGNQMSNKVWDEITYPLPNSNGCSIEFGEWINIFISRLIRGNNSSTLRLQLIPIKTGILEEQWTIVNTDSSRADILTTAKQNKANHVHIYGAYCTKLQASVIE